MGQTYVTIRIGVDMDRLPDWVQKKLDEGETIERIIEIELCEMAAGDTLEWPLILDTPEELEAAKARSEGRPCGILKLVPGDDGD